MKTTVSISNAAAAASFLLIAAASSASAQIRADMPIFQELEFADAVSGNGVHIERLLEAYPYRANMDVFECHPAASPNSYLTGLIFWPDSEKQAKTSVKVTAKAYVLVSGEIVDNAMVSQLTFGPESVKSCKASWSVKDKDKDFDYDGGTDLLTASFSCGDDLPTSLFLTPEQTTLFTDTFGTTDFGCKLSGVPTAVGVCFRGDTVVASESGPRPIRDIKMGDRVWSIDEQSGREVLRPVTMAFRRQGKELREVRVGNETIRTTDEHPFEVAGKGWVKASKLAAGDRVVTRSGEPLTVNSSRSVDSSTFYAGYERSDRPAHALAAPSVQHISLMTRNFGPQPLEDSPGAPLVYNIRVEGTHSYFVGDGRVLVHNY